MTKEELERIKQAYTSGLKVQIWFDGHWENFDARDYSMYSDPFSENRQYRIVGSAYANAAEKRIFELEKKNSELQEENEQLRKRNGELAGKLANLNRWFGEAKGIIKEYVNWDYGDRTNCLPDITKKAEAFLKEGL